MNGMEREKYADQLHQRLLQHDPVAPADFAETYLEELVRRLRARAGSVVDETLVRDAATDALLDYVQHPSKFNPKKSAIFTYLTMASYRDLQNMLVKEKRRGRREIQIQDVEISTDDGNNIVELDNPILDNMSEMEIKDLLGRVAEIFPDARDRALLDLMIDGERRTIKYCSILGIQSLSADRQRKIVKQHKDRITKRLRRLGDKIHGT
ncbi:MAG: hypothetical protein WC359_10700 [Dehalococcoidia bacterium]|jgi:RNA polymerase sigma-70 factor (ECF subfamily)